MHRWLVLTTAALGVLLAPPSFCADEIGIFETVFESSVPFSETTAALETAIAGSELELHGTHDVRIPDDLHQARLYVLTSPAYVAAASDESPRTVSAQVLRVSVYTLGADRKTYVNMANPVAHAMVFYASSDKRDELIKAAGLAASEIRELVAGMRGEPASRQQEPARTQKHYAKYKGDGPARMMAKFRNWQKSQLEIKRDSADNFDAVVDSVKAAVSAGSVADASETSGWEIVTSIPFGGDAVYVGLTNPFIEDKMVRINSRFRKDSKTDEAPYPGVDHVAALPTDVLIVRDGDDTLVLHYGQMWRMQLYFWDSGYRAFTANVGVPSKIANSIKDAVTASP
jgi:hypothetical protein